jgi:hypothetical protein
MVRLTKAETWASKVPLFLAPSSHRYKHVWSARRVKKSPAKSCAGICWSRSQDEVFDTWHCISRIIVPGYGLPVSGAFQHQRSNRFFNTISPQTRFCCGPLAVCSFPNACHATCLPGWTCTEQAGCIDARGLCRRLIHAGWQHSSGLRRVQNVTQQATPRRNVPALPAQVSHAQRTAHSSAPGAVFANFTPMRSCPAWHTRLDPRHPTVACTLFFGLFHMAS